MAMSLLGFLRYGVMPKEIAIWFGCILIVLMSSVSYAQGDKGVGEAIRVFPFEVNDSLSVNVNLEYNEEGYPKRYAAHLVTDVCSDDLCKPINITVWWDLLGRFLTYYTEEHYKLTKFDHVELTPADHIQLHKILSDTASILRDYEVEDMIDTAVHVQSQQADAVTRATSLTFDGTTVKGALYTVYTLWHFTNGALRHRIAEHTKGLLSGSFVKYMLHSGNRDYVAFTFKNLDSEDQQRFVGDIIELLGDKDDYIPHFALAQLNDKVLAHSSYQHMLLNYLPKVESSVKNALLKRFEVIQVDREGLAVLLSFVSKLKENQVALVFSIIENNKPSLDKSLIEQIRVLSHNSDKTIGRQAGDILRKID